LPETKRKWLLRCETAGQGATVVDALEIQNLILLLRALLLRSEMLKVIHSLL
jgi:hypothetical protein